MTVVVLLVAFGVVDAEIVVEIGFVVGAEVCVLLSAVAGVVVVVIEVEIPDTAVVGREKATCVKVVGAVVVGDVVAVAHFES